MKQRKIPERMCICCRQNKPKSQLLRIVLLPQGATLDTTGKVNGRGVYVCQSKQCIDKLRKMKNLEKNYGFAATDELCASLEKAIEGQN